MAKLIFLGRGRLAAATAEHLAGMNAPGAVPPDLGGVLLVLPGELARRSVRRELLTLLPDGVLPPRMLTPGQLMRFGVPEHGVRPSPAVSEMLWGVAIAEAAKHKEDFEQLFPEGAFPADPFAAAGTFRKFRDELVAGGFSVADAAGYLGDRGEELAALEELYRAELKRYGYTDPLEADREAVRETAGFAEAERVILAGLPDLPRMVREKLEAVEAAFPGGKIEIWVGDDGENAGWYDEWGVPSAEKWLDRAFLCPGEALHTALDPADAARLAVKLAGGEAGVFSPEACAVVLADPGMYPAFASEFSSVPLEDGSGTLTVGDPSGVPFSSLRLWRLGEKLLALLAEPDDYFRFAEMFRERDFLIYCAGTPERAEKRLGELDEFQRLHSPGSVGDLRRFADGGILAAADELAAWEERFDELAPADFLREFFTAIYENSPELDRLCRGIPLSAESDFLRQELCRLEEVPEGLASRIGKLRQLEIFWRGIRDQKIVAPLPEGAVAFEGCLEVPFLTQERVVFCGMNEGFFPDRLDLTPFLTDTIRQRIGLRGNRETLVRALCHLQWMCAAREKGAVEFIILRRGADGGALRPSPILFHGGALPEETLIDRCEALFKDPLRPETDEGDGGGGFHAAPELDYPRADDGTMKLPVTGIDTYLKSPFLFYWEKVRGAGSVDHSACEPDAAQSGTLCHAAFERLGKGPFASEEDLRRRLLGHFDAVIREQYGDPPPPLVTLFAENMKQRLDHAAPLLWAEAEEGFELLRAEYLFRDVPLAGALFSGKVDRIEIHRQRGIIRIIDIKTGKIEKDARGDHIKDKGGTSFTKLQLPLYALLLRRDPAFRELCPEAEACRMESGYLHLPQDVSSSAMSLWRSDDFEAILPLAETEVCRIVREIAEFPQRKLRLSGKDIPAILSVPDLRSALAGSGIELIGGAAEGPELGSRPKIQPPRAAEETPDRPAPEDTGTGTRCCECPPEVAGRCGCRHGDRSGCKCFDGFKQYSIITASAGTGKTFALASRFIRLLDFGVKPESILAITFTRKATGEIFDKIVDRFLGLILEPERPENRCLNIGRERAVTLLRGLMGSDRRELQISTIDSFFARLLKVFAPEAGIWGEIRMIDENDDRFIRDVLREWVSGIRSPEQIGELRELLKEANPGQQANFYRTLLTIVRKVHAILLSCTERGKECGDPAMPPWRPGAGDVLDDRALEETVRELETCAEECLMSGEDTMGKRVGALAEFLGKCGGGQPGGPLPGDVKKLLEDNLEAKNPGRAWEEEDGSVTLKYTDKKDFPVKCAVLVRRAFRHLRATEWRKMERKTAAVFALIRQFEALYDRRVRGAGNLTFQDLPYLLTASDPYTGETVIGPMDRRLEARLDATIDHYMFDEFQDTSDIQFKSVEPMLDELFSQIDGERFRSFFCVGDIKQSIYQWRSGDPALFDVVAEKVKPLSENAVDSLFRSYRSAQVVLDAVNRVFSVDADGDGTGAGNRYFDEVAEKIMKYRRHVSGRPEMTGHAALLDVIPFKRSSQNIPAKAAAVAAMLREIRPFERGLSVAVLARRNDTCAEVAEVLRGIGGIPVSLESRISLSGSMAVNVFREMLVLAEHPDDREAQVFLESAVFDAGDGGGERGMAALAARMDFPPEESFGGSVRRELFFSGISGLADRFCRAFAGGCGSEERRKLRVLRQVASEFTGSPDDFVRRMESFGVKSSSLRNTVQVMTFHQAKGLEFDIVFIVETGGRNGGNTGLPDREVTGVAGEHSAQLRLPAWIAYTPVKAISCRIPPLRENMEKKELEAAFEEYCGVYVAMTRAKYALYMLISGGNPDTLLREKLTPFGTVPGDSGAMAEIFRTPELAANQPRLLFSRGDRHWFGKFHPLQEEPAAETAETAETVVARPVACRTHHASDAEKAHFTVSGAELFRRRTGRDTGTAVHELLEKIGFIDDDFDAGTFLSGMEDVPDEAAEIFLAALAPGSEIREKLRHPAGDCEVWREKRFMLAGQDRSGAALTISGAFDRVVIRRDGAGQVAGAEIWDYKSDRMDAPEQFLIYLPQLRSYRASLSRLLRLPPERIGGGLFALRSGKAIPTALLESLSGE